MGLSSGGLSRRGLLRGALGAVGTLAALSSGRAMASWSPEEQRGLLAVQWNAAYRARVPLLILLIPEDQLLERGQLLGEWLMGLQDAQLAELGRVEVVCAEAGLIQERVPELTLHAKVHFVVAWPGQRRPAQALSVALPMRPEPFASWGTPEWKSEQHLAWDKARLAGEAQAIDGALWPVLVDAPVPEMQRKELAGRAWGLWVEQAPPGAHWANSGSCGVRVEHVEMKRNISCGMGHVSEMGTRLLYFVDISERVVP